MPHWLPQRVMSRCYCLPQRVVSTTPLPTATGSVPVPNCLPQRGLSWCPTAYLNGDCPGAPLPTSTGIVPVPHCLPQRGLSRCLTAYFDGDCPTAYLSAYIWLHSHKVFRPTNPRIKPLIFALNPLQHISKNWKYEWPLAARMTINNLNDQ